MEALFRKLWLRLSFYTALIFVNRSRDILPPSPNFSPELNVNKGVCDTSLVYIFGILSAKGLQGYSPPQKKEKNSAISLFQFNGVHLEAARVLFTVLTIASFPYVFSDSLFDWAASCKNLLSGSLHLATVGGE